MDYFVVEGHHLLESKLGAREPWRALCLNTGEYMLPAKETTQLLQNRGSDSLRKHTTLLQCLEGVRQSPEGIFSSLYLTYISAEFTLQDDHLEAQSLIDSTSQSVSQSYAEMKKLGKFMTI